MAVFNYTGLRTSDEKHVRGVFDADSEREARRILKKKNIYPITLEQTAADHREKPSGSLLNTFSKNVFSQKHKTSKNEIIVFTRQLAGLLEAGFSVVNALHSLEEQLSSSAARSMIVDLRNSVVEGNSLSSALNSYPQSFSPVYRNLVEAGEASGSLEVVLERLAEIMENQQELRGRLLSAVIYPFVLLATSVAVVAFLVTVVVPKIIVLFESSKQALPGITKSLIFISSFVQNWGAFLGILILISCAAFMVLLKNRKGRVQIELFLLQLPGIKNYLCQVIALRLTQTLEMLLSSGVPILKSLKVSAGTTDFFLMEERMKNVVTAVGQGEGIADALQKTGLLPELSLRMIQTGEQTGSLEKMLKRITKMHDNNIKRSTERAMNLLEPIIVLLLGAIVAYVVIAALLPIFEMNQLIN